MLAIGLMSGTSLEGIDAALVKINGSGTETDVKLMEMITLPGGIKCSPHLPIKY